MGDRPLRMVELEVAAELARMIRASRDAQKNQHRADRNAKGSHTVLRNSRISLLQGHGAARRRPRPWPVRYIFAGTVVPACGMNSEMTGALRSPVPSHPGHFMHPPGC